jgi:subtilisin family serine protease
MDAPVDSTRGRSENPNPPRAPLGREPLLAPSADVLVRYNARVLDPSKAVRVPGQPPIRPTVYIGDRLIVSGMAAEATKDTLQAAAYRNGLQVVLDEGSPHVRTSELAYRAGLQDLPVLLSTAVRLVPLPGGPDALPPAPPDAWLVLQTFRARVDTADAAQQVALDHLMTSTHHTSGSPYLPGYEETGAPSGVPSAQYGMPGWGGRAPVNWLGVEPHRADDLQSRRPVVAVLDTGAGCHPWLDDPKIVVRNPSVLGETIGIHDPGSNPEQRGVTVDPYEGVLDSDAGHGTFIAGLIRQRCPDATILAIRVMAGDGVVAESDLLDALKLLVMRQHLAQATGDVSNASGVIDAVSLSLGYYHEQPDDVTFDPQLLHPLRALSERGVAVVVAAGNDSTSRPMYPAAFTPYPGGKVENFEAGSVPLISVGALNPDRTIALFSNAGPWVTCHAPGAALVSTFPVTFDAAAQSSYRVDVPGDGVRATIDPDNFHSGFGTWSGTSFAAPVLAGELAQCLVEGKCGPIEPVDPASAVSRGWNAIGMLLGLTRP